MADPNQGALTSLDEQGGGRDIARDLAYGSSGPSLGGALGAAFDPERAADTENKAFWAGMNQGTKGGTPGEAMGNALTSQVAARESQDKLKAAYVPLIMQSLAQQRMNELGYAKFMQERQEKMNPIVDQALYGLQADGRPVSIKDAHNAIDSVGMKYRLSPQELWPHHYALEAGAGPEGANLSTYLQQRRVAAAPAEAGISKPGKSATGQTTFENPVQGTMSMPGSGGVNPTKTDVDITAGARGDPKEYSDRLRLAVSGYGDMLQRLNAIGSNLDEFQPGKYAGSMAGVAAAIKDLSNRFPNASSETIKAFANKLLGPEGKGGDPVAAAQFAEALKAQEAIAQTRAMLAGEGRIGQQEVRIISQNIPGNLTDPGAYKKFISFMRGMGANAMNKYQGWADHVSSTEPSKLSVHGFDVPWEAKLAQQLHKGAFGQLDVPRNVVGDKEEPPAPKPAAAPEPVATSKSVDLKGYEPGARVGPTGKVYVIENGMPRPARKAGARQVGATGSF